MNYTTKDFSEIHDCYKKPDKAGWYVTALTLFTIERLHERTDKMVQSDFLYFGGDYWRWAVHGTKCVMQNMFFFGLNHDPKAKGENK